MSTGYHEADLSQECRDIHRALASLQEELEAAEWYNQRGDVCPDEELKAILEHNRNEEIQHASMLLEYLRRQMPEFDGQLKTYLFTSEPITEIEDEEEAGDESGEHSEPKAGDLGIGRNM